MRSGSMSTFRRAGIKLLAIDFDLTLIDVHTEGCWTGSAAALASRVRPCIKEVVDEALGSGIHVAVVTFSSQVTLISKVLVLLFPDDAHKVTHPHHIFIQHCTCVRSLFEVVMATGSIPVMELEVASNHTCHRRLKSYHTAMQHTSVERAPS